jgi:hypothetical protein
MKLYRDVEVQLQILYHGTGRSWVVNIPLPLENCYPSVLIGKEVVSVRSISGLASVVYRYNSASDLNRRPALKPVAVAISTELSQCKKIHLVYL